MYLDYDDLEWNKEIISRGKELKNPLLEVGVREGYV